MKNKYVVLDFETTGVNRYHNDEVVQVAIVNQDDEVLINELCKPKHIFLGQVLKEYMVFHH